MRKQKFIQKSLFLLMVGFGLLLFTSCSNDDDGNSSANQTISFRVNLVKIKATDTSGEGNAANNELEIFGELSASLSLGTTVDLRELWSADADNYISVGQNDSQLTGETTFTIAANQLNTSVITCSGDLMEWDGVTDFEDQGTSSASFALATITGTQEFDLTFSETVGQTCVVTFSITRL
ncbi:MAG: hypothetical protein NWP87_06135 [Winogradskyella sp.]|nr:hypothetical protein [Winogradskyella sp.]